MGSIARGHFQDAKFCAASKTPGNLPFPVYLWAFFLAQFGVFSFSLKARSLKNKEFDPRGTKITVKNSF